MALEQNGLLKNIKKWLPVNKMVSGELLEINCSKSNFSNYQLLERNC